MDAPSYPIKALFAPAAGPGIGGGHVMRCLTLAETLTARGGRCDFLVNAAGAALVDRFGGGAFRVYRDSLPIVLASEAFDVLVLDDYAAASDQEQALRSAVRRLVVIDDLADRPHLADLLVDPGYGRTDADYARHLAADAVRLTGPRYALVKPAFERLRQETLARPVPAQPQRLFLSFGLSDIDEIAARAVAAVRSRSPDLHIDLALASDAPSAPKLNARAKTDPNLRVHLDATNVANLMAGADMGVGAGGASTWERACLGLPTLAVIVADNQRAVIDAMAKDDALLAVDLKDPAFEQTFMEKLTRIGSPEVRMALKQRSAALCDGLGAERVADAIFSL